MTRAEDLNDPLLVVFSWRTDLVVRITQTNAVPCVGTGKADKNDPRNQSSRDDDS